MGEGGPPRRRTPLSRGGPLPRRSAKRVARDRVEGRLKRQLLARDGGCVLRCRADVPRCRGQLDKHETIPRSLWPAGALEASNCAILCRGHHDWIEDTAEGRAFGTACGLRRGSRDAPPPGSHAP